MRCTQTNFYSYETTEWTYAVGYIHTQGHIRLLQPTDKSPLWTDLRYSKHICYDVDPLPETPSQTTQLHTPTRPTFT